MRSTSLAAGAAALTLTLLLSACGSGQSGSSGPSSDGSPSRQATGGAATTSTGGTAARSSTPPAQPPVSPSGAGSAGAPASTSPAEAPAGGSASAPRTAPSPGNVHRTVQSGQEATRPAVPVTATAPFGNKVSVVITGRAPVTATGRGPGEKSGPAVALTLRITNGSAQSIPLDAVLVDVQTAQGISADPIQSPPAKPFTGQLAAGSTATATYVFTLAPADRRSCTVRVSYSATASTVVLTGDLT